MVLVVFAFLREWRTTLIPVIAIPVSIIGAFGVMAAAGFSINTLTLLGIVLSIGLVVDDAIVVLENIYAKIESGQAPLDSRGDRRHERGVHGGDRDDDCARRRVPAAVVHGGHLGPPVPRVRHDDRRRRADLRSGRADSHADAELAAAARRGRATAGCSSKTEPLFTALDRSYGASLAAFLQRRAAAPLAADRVGRA